MQMAEKWPALEQRMAVPAFEFGIIAGGRGPDKMSNPPVQGDDDFVVGVEETKLPGARDFMIAPVLHSTMMDNSSVMTYVLNFLQTGSFDPSRPRHELPPNETGE